MLYALFDKKVNIWPETYCLSIEHIVHWNPIQFIEIDVNYCYKWSSVWDVEKNIVPKLEITADFV